MRFHAATLLALLCCLGGECLADSIVRASAVSTIVTDEGSGVYRYEYTVQNTSPAGQVSPGGQPVWPLIVDFEIPIDSPGDLWGVDSPDTWSYEFLTAAEYVSQFGEANPFGAAYILHWFDMWPPIFEQEEEQTKEEEEAPKEEEQTKEEEDPAEEEEEPAEEEKYKAIAPADYAGALDVYLFQTGGFVFFSNLSPVDGPYLTSWSDEFRSIGDPPLPGGALVGGDGTLSFSAAVPIPASGAMGLLGLIVVAMLGIARRRMA